MEKKMNDFEAMMKIEHAEFDTDEDYVDAWQTLIDSGLVWKLQGCYGRRAAQLIEQGICKAKA
jgi:hypothetical protein